MPTSAILRLAVGALAGGVALGGLAVWGWLAAPGPATSPETDAAACSPADPCLAIVIDDIGRDPAALNQLLAIPAPLTFAVLPHARHTAAAVARLRAEEREYLVHLPLEPHDLSQITDEPLVLRRGRISRAAVEECLARVPGAVGVNNHMGSAVSESRSDLRRIFTVVARRGLWVLDSRTSPRSQICDVSRRAGLSCVGRQLFLDDPPDFATIKRRLLDATRLARERGSAIVIGHPLETTIFALAEHLALRPGVRVVELSRLVNKSGIEAVAQRRPLRN